MTKTLTKSAFVTASLVVILVFVTSKTYPQLIVAGALYTTLVFLAFMIFPRKAKVHLPPKLNHSGVEKSKPKTEAVDVADIDRRTFIKLIGATGVSFFLFSILGSRVEALLFGRSPQFGTSPIGSGGQFPQPGASPTDGYKIAEIDEGPVTYYGFTNQVGAWIIMREEAEGSSFRYAKGNSDFPNNWDDRKDQNYDYFFNLS